MPIVYCHAPFPEHRHRCDRRACDPSTHVLSLSVDYHTITIIITIILIINITIILIGDDHLMVISYAGTALLAESKIELRNCKRANSEQGRARAMN